MSRAEGGSVDVAGRPHYLVRFHAHNYTRAGMWSRATVIPKEIRMHAALVLDLVLACWELDANRGRGGPFARDGVLFTAMTRASLERGIHPSAVATFVLLASRSGCYAGDHEAGGTLLMRKGFRMFCCAGYPVVVNADFSWSGAKASPRMPQHPLEWAVAWNGVASMLRHAEARESEMATRIGPRTAAQLPQRFAQSAVAPAHIVRHLGALAEWCEDSEAAMLSWMTTGAGQQGGSP